MSQSIGNVFDEGVGFAQGIENGAGHPEIGALLVAGEVIDLTRLSPSPGRDHASAMVVDMDPISNLKAIAIDG